MLAAFGLLKWNQAGEEGSASSSGASVEGSPGEEEEEGRVVEMETDVYGLDGYRLTRVPRGSPGARLKILLPDMERPRTFYFAETAKRKSVVFATTVERPVGIVFGESSEGRVVITQVDKGTDAYRKSQVAKLGEGDRFSAPEVGDRVRACSSINFFYSQASLFGVKPPARTVVLFGTEGKSFDEFCSALSKSQVSDGDLTLVLERDKEEESSR
ncbi:hypothetical protein HOP50_12g67690 [Chloropicon primus]|nr:hypothetical protein A3770_12p67510 [Chloropicon primus]UPR03440.1 hypothetical protein HOP50_12g67690 [Chloropicon primus]|eukprot:QDZ24233.1 hypothetical protein A3770_12p67510 [Chloropicon primus]